MQISAAVGNECAGSIRRVQQAFKKNIEQPGKSIYTHILTFIHLYLFLFYYPREQRLAARQRSLRLWRRHLTDGFLLYDRGFLEHGCAVQLEAVSLQRTSGGRWERFFSWAGHESHANFRGILQQLLGKGLLQPGILWVYLILNIL